MKSQTNPVGLLRYYMGCDIIYIYICFPNLDLYLYQIIPFRENFEKMKINTKVKTRMLQLLDEMIYEIREIENTHPFSNMPPEDLPVIYLLKKIAELELEL